MKFRSRRRFGRKSFRKRWRPRRKGYSRGSVKYAVARILDQKTETKVAKINGSYDVLNDRVASCQPLVQITRGTGNANRIGEQIRLVGIKVVYHFVPGAGLWTSNTRLRMMVLRGAAFSPGVAGFQAEAVAVADGLFDHAARGGHEIVDTDYAKLILNKETVIPVGVNQTSVQNNAVPAINQISNETMDDTHRYKLWFSGRKGLVKWRSAASQSLFTQSQPILALYAWHAQTAQSVNIGTLYYTIHVYYKDA